MDDCRWSIVWGDDTFLSKLCSDGNATRLRSVFNWAFMAFVQVSGVPFLAENSTSAERVHMFSIHFSLMTVANVVGSLAWWNCCRCTPMFLQWILLNRSVGHYFWAQSFLLLGLLPLFKLKSGTVKNDGLKRRKESLTEEKMDSSFKRNLILIFHFSFASLLIGIGSGLVIPYLNLYFSNRFDASNAYIGLILSLGSAMTAVAMLIGPAVVKRIGKVKALILFQLLSLPFLILNSIYNFTTSCITRFSHATGAYECRKPDPKCSRNGNRFR